MRPTQAQHLLRTLPSVPSATLEGCRSRQREARPRTLYVCWLKRATIGARIVARQNQQSIQRDVALAAKALPQPGDQLQRFRPLGAATAAPNLRWCQTRFRANIRNDAR